MSEHSRPAIRRRRYRPGLGDLVVLSGVLVLGWLSVEPHLRGRALAAAERRARSSLRRLLQAATASGLVRALEECQRRVAEIEELRVVVDDRSAGSPHDFWPAWQDEAYFYRLNLASRVHGAAIVDATPQEPGITGSVTFRANAAGYTRELPLREVHGSRPAAEHEGRARSLVARLAHLAAAAGLPEAAREFEGRVRTFLRPDAPGQAPQLAASRAFPRFEDDDHLYAVWLLAGSEPAGIALEAFAWPSRPGKSGFAAFRLTGQQGLQQSRNLVRRYGREVTPLPGAGVIRPGSRLDGTGGYTGRDGNRWFPVHEE